MEQQQFYTVTEVASMLRVSRQTVHEWLRRGLLKSIKVGRSRRIPVAAYQEFTRVQENEHAT